MISFVFIVCLPSLAASFHRPQGVWASIDPQKSTSKVGTKA